MVRSCVGGLGLFCTTYNGGGIRCLLQSGEYEPIIGAKLGRNSTQISEGLATDHLAVEIKSIAKLCPRYVDFNRFPNTAQRQHGYIVTAILLVLSHQLDNSVVLLALKEEGREVFARKGDNLL